MSTCLESAKGRDSRSKKRPDRPHSAENVSRHGYHRPIEGDDDESRKRDSKRSAGDSLFRRSTIRVAFDISRLECLALSHRHSPLPPRSLLLNSAPSCMQAGDAHRRSFLSSGEIMGIGRRERRRGGGGRGRGEGEGRFKIWVTVAPPHSRKLDRTLLN